MSLRGIRPKIIVGVSVITYIVYLIIVLLVYNIFLPYREVTPANDLENLEIWGYRVLFGKIFSLVTTVIVGLLIARFIHKENRNYLNGVFGGLLFALYGIILYIVRFGIENYNKYNNFLETIIWSVI